MENIVYSYGGGQALYKVLIGVKMIFDSDISKDLTYLMTFIGLAWAAFQGAQQNSWTPKLSWLTKYVLITSLFITPTATLWVTDVVYGTRYKVDNLPIGLVLPASVFSGIGYGVTTVFEQAFSSNENIEYAKYGQSFGAALISQARNFKIQDSGFRENMESFIDNCVLYDVMVGRKYNASELKDSTNIWGLVSKDASNIRMMNYRDNNKSLGRRLVSCREGVALLNSYWTKDLSKLGETFGSTIFGKYGSQISQAVNSTNQEALGKSFIANVNVVTQLYGKTGAATDTLKQIMMINAVADIPMSYGAVRAKQQQQESWLISGQLAREILPTLHAIFAALIYASFPLIIGMLVLPSGFKTLGNYFGLLIWIETWPPLFAVINLLTNVSSKSYGGDFTAITMSSASQIISHNNNISVVASGMMIVLPYLSYNILKGGAGQFVHLANQVMGSSQSAAMGASNEVTSGNRSLDNVSMMNGQWSNNSGFKTDMNMSYKAGHRDHQLGDGTMVKETADGSTILQSGAGITHSVGEKSMHTASTDSSQDHQSLSKEQAIIVEERAAYEKSQSSMRSRAVDLVNRLASGENSGEHYSYNTSTSDGKNLSSAVGKTKEIHDNHTQNSSQSIANSIGGNASGSFGVGGSGGGMSASIGLDSRSGVSSDDVNIQTFAENKGASTNTNVTNNAESIARAAKDMQFSETQTEEKALADSLVASYQESQNLSKAISASEQKIERYQASSDNSQSKSHTTTDDDYHKQLNFIANKSDNFGFKIGEIGAQKIINKGGPEYENYIEDYQSKNMPQQKMVTQPSFDYEKTVKDNIPQDVNFKENYNEVLNEGNAQMKSSGGVVKDAKLMVDEQNKSTSATITSEEKNILQNGEELQARANKGLQNRSKLSKMFYGRNKDENNSFME
jgi:conjugal transfer mating pair stabilization protein TraG